MTIESFGIGDKEMFVEEEGNALHLSYLLSSSSSLCFLAFIGEGDATHTGRLTPK